MSKAKKTGSEKPKKKIIKKSIESKNNEQIIDFPEKDITSMTTIQEQMPNIIEKPKKGLGNLVSDTNNNDSTGSELKRPEVFEKNDKGFTLNEPVYLQVHVGNIYSIFGSGIILPSKYIKNRAFHDPQSINHEYLVLSNSVFSSEGDSTALLEINLLKDENSELKIAGSIAYLEKPISISRIKRIYVTNEKVKKEIISTALINDGGIIPETLLIASLPRNTFHINFDKFDFKENNTDYTSKVTQYNKVLGALAYLKNYAILLSEKSNSAATYPEHYFLAMQSLNDSLPFQVTSNDKITTFYSQLFGLQNSIDNASLKWIFDRLNVGKNFNDEDVKDFGSVFLNTLATKENYNSAREILSNLRLSLERKKALQDILQLPGPDKFSLYLFALLRIYGNASTEEKSISRIDMPDYLSLNYGEYVFAILGYFYGYATLRNFDDKINVRDNVFLDVLNISKRIPIKFELTTMFDYIVLESVYANIFTKARRTVNTSFLESDSIKQEWAKQQIQVSDNYTYKADEIFGKQVYQVTRKSVSYELLELLNKLPMEVPVISDLGVFCFRNKIPYHFINLGDLLQESRLKYFIYFKKENILEAVKNKKINEAHLKHRIESSITAKEI